MHACVLSWFSSRSNSWCAVAQAEVEDFNRRLDKALAEMREQEERERKELLLSHQEREKEVSGWRVCRWGVHGRDAVVVVADD